MGMGSYRRWLLVGFCSLACTGPTLGQEQLNLADIRKNNFPSIDRQRVQEWCQQKIRQVLASKEPLKDGPAFLAEVNKHLNPPEKDATAAFKTGMIEAMAAAFAAEYKPATDARNPTAALGAVCLLAFMKNHDNPAVVACYKLAIKDAASSVRLVAAEGLLRSKVSAQDWDAILPELQKQGSIETDPSAIDRIYRLLMMTGGPTLDKVVPVLMTIMDARLTRFEQTGEFPVTGDANVIAWLAGKLAQINNNQTKNDIIRRAARLLADAVYHYTETPAGRDQRQNLERVVVIIEQHLKAMTKGSGNQAQPDVTTAMTEGGEDRNARMKKEIGAWIGTDQSAGLLNNAPFAFERGLGIKRPAPATGPAASSPATLPAR